MEPHRGLSRVIGVRDDPTGQVAELYAVACPRLIGYLTVLTGSRADAEEIAQDTFVQALRHWSRIRQYDDPAAWLHRVATRLAISRGRRGQVAHRGLRRLGAGLEDLADVSPDSRLDLDAALTRLRVDHRAVLLLHHAHDLPVAEVARVLGIAEGTVKSRLARARAALQPMLDDPRSTS
jgi:RNA polymerase sigma-70 factor (ECF subfamily)